MVCALTLRINREGLSAVVKCLPESLVPEMCRLHVLRRCHFLTSLTLDKVGNGVFMRDFALCLCLAYDRG